MAIDELAAVEDCELFKGLPKKKLKAIKAAGKIISFDDGAEIAAPESKRMTARFFVILDGQAKVLVNRRTRRRLGAGDSFGEISLLDGLPRSATVVADGPVTTWSLASWNFRPLLRADSEIAERVIVGLCRMLREAERDANRA